MIARRALGVGTARAGLAFVAVALALATPALVAAPALRSVDELTFGRAVARAFSGVTFPVAGAVLAVLLLSKTSRIRRGADRLVGAGLPPARAARFLVLVTLLCAVGVAAPLGAAVVATLRGAAHLGPTDLAVRDVLGTAWAAALGAAAWTAVGAAFLARSGQPSRALLVLAIDLPTRMLPGGAAWLAPGAHLDNVLGAPPPRGLLPVPVLPQLVSVAALVAVALLGAWIALLRYEAADAT